MQAIPLGLVTVTTAGIDQPLTLTATQKKVLPPNGLVARIDVWPNPLATGTVFVRSGGVTLAALPANSTGSGHPWKACDRGEGVNPLVFALGALTNGDGAYVTIWVE